MTGDTTLTASDACSSSRWKRPSTASIRSTVQKHRRCGDLDGAVERDRVRLTCTCGAVLVRVVAFG